MSWKVTLTDGTIHTDDRSPDCWRRLKQRCDKNGVKIKTLFWNDKIVDPRADYYFVMHEIKAFISTGYTTLKKGIGSVRNGKSYIDWYLVPTGDFESREVQPIKDFVWEITIPKEKA